GSVALTATIDRRLDEPGVVELAARLGVPLRGYPAEELAAVGDAPSPSAEVARHVGTPGVCEPAAILASEGGALVVPKRKSAMGTIAIARRSGTSPVGRGHLVLVSLGPGALDLLTPRARRALLDADAVIGYRAYLDLLTTILPTSVLRPYELGEERERAAAAIALARVGKRVALVSSGDVGVYGMAGLVYELLRSPAGSETPECRTSTPEASEASGSQPPNPRASEPLAVEVVPGVTAATAAAALLGAPLMLDFAAISLSDLLVPWEQIERRLAAVATGDLVIALYNPASARRRRQLTRAKEILLGHRPADTLIGIVREAYRPDQSVKIATLADLDDHAVDMKTVVIVGNSSTVRVGDRLVTRRGYLGDAGGTRGIQEPAGAERGRA
ncbi:MAG: cobalamin biosynthesis protein, partial [Chloroflexota bacterium]|nr:cobalamin biosynthesis protein [Chloroflexota bacterium]